MVNVGNYNVILRILEFWIAPHLVKKNMNHPWLQIAPPISPGFCRYTVYRIYHPWIPMRAPISPPDNEWCLGPLLPNPLAFRRASWSKQRCPENHWWSANGIFCRVDREEKYYSIYIYDPHVYLDLYTCMYVYIYLYIHILCIYKKYTWYVKKTYIYNIYISYTL